MIRSANSRAPSKTINGEVLPEFKNDLRGANMTFKAADDALSADSPLQQNLGLTLEELRRTARSLRAFSDYLGSHPEALIRGRRTDDPPAEPPPKRPAVSIREQTMILSEIGCSAVALAGAAVLGACASAPVHYYTLVAADPQGYSSPRAPSRAPRSRSSSWRARCPLKSISRSSSCARARSASACSRANAGLRRSATKCMRHWPLIWRAPCRGRMSRRSLRAGKPVLRIQLKLRRFESAPAAYALIEAAWSLRREPRCKRERRARCALDL
jgi:hypothetical protein